MANPHGPQPTEITINETTYRGYRVSLFGGGDSWSFGAVPVRRGIPHLDRSIFYCVARSAMAALDTAKAEIDQVLVASDK